ncbi:hypothetical protein N9Z72_00120 [Akkermansiaceae bacterium]|nr:hypothetical protein [Akkermansiaceae bacterium]
MAYTKLSNKSQDKDVRYLNKDFNTFKQQLVEFTKVYYPNTYNDFSEGSPGMMFLEMAAYVGDVLSFYTDTQLQETFLALAQEKENLYHLAYAMGYKPKITTTSTTDLDIFQLLPAKIVSNTYKPDFDYALKINPGSLFASTEGPIFRLDDRIDFEVSSSFEPTEINVYQLDNNNNPQYYLIKKKAKAIQANLKSQTFPVGISQKFLNLNIIDNNIIGIESITDSDGNKWTEVPYMAQDTLFEDIENIGANDPELSQYNNQTPYLLKLKKVPKRFITRFLADGTLQLSFGSGVSDKDDEQIIPNPDNIGLGLKDGSSKINTAFDPSNFLYTGTYGEAPSNTTITVNYLVGGGISANVSANTITKNELLNITQKPNLVVGTANFIGESIVTTNPEAATGGGGGDTIEEIRMNTMASFSSQQRAVTKNDYIVRTYSMPSKFGRIAKAYITQDDQITPLTTEPNRIPNPLALNLYVLGYNNNKQLTNLNKATKNNLATYLEEHRMLTDAVNIKNAFPINVGLDFEIVTFKSYNNQQVLLDCITELKDYFNVDKWQINQPIIISEAMNLISNVQGVISVQKFDIINLAGEDKGYSQYKYDMEGATRSGVIYPSLDPSIFEVKYPDLDIKGRVTTY